MGNGQSFTKCLLKKKALPNTKISKQSLAQFAYEMIAEDGLEAGLKTYEKYQQSEKFYFDKNEIYTTAHLFYQRKQVAESTAIFEIIPKYFPSFEQSMAHQLFMVIVKDGEEVANEWYQKNGEESSFYIDDFEFEKAIQTLINANKLPEARFMGALLLEKFPQDYDAYELMAEIALEEGEKESALHYLRTGLATDDVITFMELWTTPKATYVPTVLPKDTTALFLAEGSWDSDIAFVFVQGGPMPDISAYHPRPLSLLPNQDKILRIEMLESQMINQTVLSAFPHLTEKQCLYEHNQNSEILLRTIKYLKNRGKTVYVLGHSYGCLIGFDFLYTKENLADKIILMGSDLDEDLRNFEKLDNGEEKITRWRNGIEPYRTTFGGNNPLNALYQEKRSVVFSNTVHLVASSGKRRFTQLLAGKDLSNVIFMHGKFDESNGRTSKAELDFWHRHGAITIESYGDHHSMLTPAFMTNMYNHLVLNEPLKKSVAATLSDNIEAKGIDFALAFYHENKNSNDYYPIVETEINMLGYQLVAAKNLTEALAIFQLNVEAFPNSWNAHDSLGETYLALGNKELGAMHYKKSLEIHPGNMYGIRALRE